MSQSKPTLHNIYTMTSTTISTTTNRIQSSLFRCSPKLSVSGESWMMLLSLMLLVSIPLLMAADMYFKFVVADQDDVDEVGRAVDTYREAGVDVPVYLMPLGGRSEEYTLNVQEVANLCMERGWRFSPRLHISLFGNAWGT